MKTLIRRVAVVLGAAAAVRCSSEQLSQRLVELSAERASGEVATDDVRVEFVSVPAGPLAGDVSIDVTLLWAELPLAFELHYDYESGDVTTDGHGARLTLRSSRVLADAVERLSQELGPDNSELPLHAQMLFAALVVLAESGGIPLTPMTFRTDGGDMPDATTVPKSLEDDGVTCIQRGNTYLASFDFGTTQVVDLPIQADSRSCNGRCGPSCTALTPWQMWTLDCLEHDSCCNASGDSTTCWTPLGDCGDEYADAEADFLRGFDPLRRHCRG